MLINFHLTSKESRAQSNLFSNSISAALMAKHKSVLNQIQNLCFAKNICVFQNTFVFSICGRVEEPLNFKILL